MTTLPIRGSPVGNFSRPSRRTSVGAGIDATGEAWAPLSGEIAARAVEHMKDENRANRRGAKHTFMPPPSTPSEEAGNRLYHRNPGEEMKRCNSLAKSSRYVLRSRTGPACRE